MRDAATIIHQHYLGPDQVLSDTAFDKYEAYLAAEREKTKQGD